MLGYHCLSLLVLGVACVNALPVQDFDTGFQNHDGTLDADTYTGYFTYTDNHIATLSSSSEELQTLVFIQDPCPVGQIFQSELSICIDYPHGSLLPPKQYQEQASNSDIMLNDAAIVSQSSVTKLTMDDWGVNHGCKSSENYISELDICLEEGSFEAFQKSSSGEVIMLGDSPIIVSVEEQNTPISKANQRASSSVIKLTMDDWGINHGCRPEEIYISELDICYDPED